MTLGRIVLLLVETNTLIVNWESLWLILDRMKWPIADTSWQTDILKGIKHFLGPRRSEIWSKSSLAVKETTCIISVHSISIYDSISNQCGTYFPIYVLCIVKQFYFISIIIFHELSRNIPVRSYVQRLSGSLLFHKIIDFRFSVANV